MTMGILCTYPTLIYYGNDGSRYECTSVLAGKGPDLYRLIVRVSDRALQMLRADHPPPLKNALRLYSDPDLTDFSGIAIPNADWKLPQDNPLGHHE